MELQGWNDGAAQKKRAKRGRWMAAQRQEIVAASYMAGASINEVAERFGIRPNLLTAWRRRAARTGTVSKAKRKRTRFAAVRLKAAAMDPRIASRNFVTQCLTNDVTEKAEAGSVCRVLLRSRPSAVCR